MAFKLLMEKYPNINDRTLAELDQLFEATTPEKLRKSLHLLLSYFLRESPFLDSKKYRPMIEDACFVIEFLDNISDKS